MVTPYDHVRVRGTERETADSHDDAPTSDVVLSPGTYRVVGRDAERVTLLEVADATGERVHTGRVERVPHAVLDRAELVDSPDPSGSVAAVRNQLGGLALTARYAPRRLAHRPIQTVLGVVLVAADLVGSSVVPSAPESLLTVVGVFGVFVLTATALDQP